MVAHKGIKTCVFIIKFIITANLQAVKGDYSTPPKVEELSVTAFPVQGELEGSLLSFRAADEESGRGLE